MTDELRDQIAEKLNSTIVDIETGDLAPAADRFDRHDRHDRHRFLHNCVVCRGDVAVIAEVAWSAVEPKLSEAMAEAEDWKQAANGWEERAERVTAERDAAMAEAEQLRGKALQLEAASNPRNAELIGKLVRHSTRLVQIERDDARQRAERAEAAIEFLYSRQVHDGPGVRLDNKRCRGRSADALAWYGAGMREEPRRDEYPLDRGDLAACERTVDMAPARIAERMRPVLDLYIAALNPAGGSEKGCCNGCGGSGHSGDEDTNGLCWDCRGTGHSHDGPCDPAGGSEKKEDPSSGGEA